MSNAAAINKFTKKIVDTATIVDKTQRQAVTAAAAATKVAFLAAPGAPHMVAGKRATVTYNVRDGGQVTFARVGWNGKVHLVNNRTAPHIIRPRKFVGTRGTGLRAQRAAGLLALLGVDASAGSGGIKLADGRVRRFVMHPGTSGKFFFQKGKTVAERVAPDVWGRTNKIALAKHFAGG